MAENLFQLQSGYKSYGSKDLFLDAAFSVNEDEHIGVIGPNGAGKTTLFKILVGQESLDSGQVIRSQKLNVGYLSQHDHWQPGETGNSYLERISQIPIWELKPEGKSLQLTEEILDQPIPSLSGGYRMRIKLLGLLGQRPNLMLLDEPTNYLDLETTLLIERFLQDYRGSFLLISHDREFLRRTTDHTLEVEAGEITKYSGNIDDYFEQKELLRDQLEARAMGLAQKRKAILDFVERFGAKASKARQAQSRLKTLSKMETIEMKPLHVGAHIRIPSPVQTGKKVLSIEKASFGYGDKVVLKDVSLNILRGDHVAVIGLNGAGKSTLLKGIAGFLAPLRGLVERGLNVDLAFFHQHVVEALNPDDTVRSAMSRAAHKDVTPQEVLDLAGSLLFSGSDVEKTIRVLSGGEKSRVALGQVLLAKAPCIILDEPTNHLDFQTVEAMTLALQKYEGTVIVVSHDRAFVRRVGTRILEVNHGGLYLYPGTYDEYVWNLERSMNSGEHEQSQASQKRIDQKNSDPEGQDSRHFHWKEAKKELDKKLRTTERRIGEVEKELGTLEKKVSELNDLLMYPDPNSVVSQVKIVQELGQKGARVQELEAEWIAFGEEKQSLEDQIKKMLQKST